MKNDKPNYKIIEGNYNDFIKYNGLKYKDKPVALEIRDNIAKYLMVFDGEELYSEVIVFDEKEVLINLTITFMINAYLDELLDYLKGKYKYVTFKSDETLNNNLEEIRKKCKIVDESEEILKTQTGVEIKIVSLKIRF